MLKGRRVVVVGMGLRSPIGDTPEDFIEALKDGRSGVKAMPEWDQVKDLGTRVAGVCEGEIDEKIILRRHRRSMGRIGILSALAAMDAVADSGLVEDVIASPACGVSFGSTQGSTTALVDFSNHMLVNGGFSGLLSSTYLKFMAHTCAANLAVMFGARGPEIASCTACTSGSQGVGFGYQAIKYGQAEVMITGGAEEMHFSHAGIFDVMRATSTRYNDRPHLTPRPFDAERDGLVVGEGAGCLVLEEYERARKRGARIWAEVVGYGTNCNGNHLTHSDAAGIAEVIQTALKDAALSADRIEYINAHATATETGDLAEAEGSWQVLGPNVPISSLKGQMGHTLGASGAIESVATILMMTHGFVAPTRNLDKPDPELAPLDHVIGEPRQFDFSTAMNNNFAFGGVNTSLIFTKV
ncbi:MAG: beta-ketoacyl-[acyl-carrier-protein] synthase family protein [Proteobacteria bacterium]|nr:beta-ketoacyl-[acyl-carrier-protein] synthase family protein [Pseudomonadota bacterium]MBU1741736.1 beta-ketoacyl-[acyl-carrier-protein] synthase family protein [Pseudomonadota bacterium]